MLVWRHWLWSIAGVTWFLSNDLSQSSSWLSSCFTGMRTCKEHVKGTERNVPRRIHKDLVMKDQEFLAEYYLVNVRTLVQTSYIVRWDRWPTSHRFVPFGCGLVVNSATIRQSDLLVGPHKYYLTWYVSTCTAWRQALAVKRGEWTSESGTQAVMLRTAKYSQLRGITSDIRGRLSQQLWWENLSHALDDTALSSQVMSDGGRIRPPALDGKGFYMEGEE